MLDDTRENTNNSEKRKRKKNKKRERFRDNHRRGRDIFVRTNNKIQILVKV